MTYEAPAPSREEWDEANRRKRVIDLARAIFVRDPRLPSTQCLLHGEEFDAAAEKYRKDGAL